MSSKIVENYDSNDAYYLDVQNVTLAYYTQRSIKDVYVYVVNHTLWHEDSLRYYDVDTFWDEFPGTQVAFHRPRQNFKYK